MAHICPNTRCQQEVIVGSRSVLFRHQYWHMSCAERVFEGAMTVDGFDDSWYELPTEERIRILEAS